MTQPLPEHTKQASAALREASNKSMEIAKQCAASRKAAMTPPLPNPAIQTTAFSRDSSTQSYYTAEQMTEYGKACRAAALEEAAQLICESEVRGTPQDVHLIAGLLDQVVKNIRSLKEASPMSPKAASGTSTDWSAA